MKRIAIMVLVLFVLSACAAPAAVAPTTPTVAPQCDRGVCVNRAFAYVNQTNTVLLVEFSLTDEAGKVDVSAAPRLKGDINVGVFKVDGDMFLIAAQLSESMYDCYSGNDMPWSKGKLAASCSVSFPANKTQEAVTVGERVRVEIIEYGVAQTLTVQALNK